MENINITTWIRNVIASKERLAIPIMTNPGIEIIGRTVKEAVTNGEVHAAAIKALDEKYPSSGATVIMDLTVEAEAFGAQVKFPENEVPTVIGSLLKDDADIEALAVPDLSKGRIQEYLKANKIAAQSISGKPVFAGCIGPYSLAGRLYDMSEMMLLLYMNPDAANTLLQKCTDFLIAYCKELKKTGVHGIIIAEPAAGLLPNDDCNSFSSVFVAQIVQAVQDEYFAIILHNCGNTGHCTKAMLETGAAGYHFGNKIDMLEAVKGVPGDKLVLGNLDPVGIFKSSTAEEMKSKSLELLDKMRQYPNFIISSGCDVPPNVPFENIEAFYSALNEYNEKL